MRLVLNLVLLSLLASVSVLVGYAYVSIQSHRASLTEDMQRDHAAMMSVLVETVETVVADHGEPAARRLVDEVNRRRDNVDLSWIPLSGATDYSLLQRTSEDGTSLETRAPVVIDGATVGSLLLVESFEGGELVLAARRSRIFLTGVGMVACGTLVGAGLGLVLVGRRIRALVVHARRVADGDLDSRITSIGSADELGELGREMNAMTAKLADARARVRSESEAKVQALEQLRHGERLMTVGKLAAGMAHELGTPLNVVAESARMIHAGETDAESSHEYAKIIADQAERMTGLLRQLMDFARRRPPRRAAADLQDLARLAITLITPLADSCDVALHLQADDPCVAWVDAGQIQQVLANLLVNAIQASPPGANVEVIVKHAMGPRAPAASVQPQACVAVVDHGTGIDEESLPHVFTPFFTTKDVGSGTGLGLSVAHGLTREHGGWIEAISEVGAGSTFKVWLPLLDGDED